MRLIFILVIQLLVSGVVLAQQPSIKAPVTTPNSTIRICTPSRHNLLKPGPLYVLYSRNTIIARGDSLIPALDPKMIKSIYVLKDTAATKAYGLAGKSGVIEITIDDVKYPDAYKTLKQKVQN